MQLVGPDQAVAGSDILTLARHMVRTGHQMTVAGPLSRLQQEQITVAGARWVNLPLAPFSDPVGRTQNARQLRLLLQGDPVDLLHCYGLPAGLTAAAATRRLRGAPRTVLTLDDLSAHRLTRGEAWSARRALKPFAAVIVSADSELQALRQLDPRLASRARLIHHSAVLRAITADFDLGRKRRSLGLRAETAVIAVISPAVTSLGLTTFLDAAVTINRDFPNVEFLLVGDGPDQEELVLYSHHQGTSGAVIFRGTRADLPEIIASINILVIPREVPGSIVYALQALTQEIPVVSVRTSALEEIIAPVEPEAFVPQDDVSALIKALSQRLEILPPPDSDDFAESLFSYGDMVVSGAGFDLDQVGLEAQYRGDESEMQRAVREAQAKYGARRCVEAIREVYAEVLKA